MRINILVLGVIASIPTIFGAKSVQSEPIPKLPEIPYDYSVTLPLHLQSIPQPPRLILRATEAVYPARQNELATLGRVLFYDTGLSANNLVSCASCHKQANGFDDPTPFSIGFKGLITERNAMGLTNARFNANGRYFWDERANSLEHQSLQPFFDPIEMGLNNGQLVEKVAEADYYAPLFKQTFSNPKITREKIALALSAFISSIVSTRSPYDIERAKVGNALTKFAGFTVRENRGKFLFFASAKSGGAGCGSCHHSEAFIASPKGKNNGIDANTGIDQGIGKITQLRQDNGKFRPPSLVNIAERAPYMHDGRFSSLGEVIDHYSNGIKNHPNLGDALKNLDQKPRKFNFNQRDRAALIAFLKTLSDENTLTNPKFSNPFIQPLKD